jgi:transglutaminase-like putative cysteine protease
VRYRVTHRTEYVYAEPVTLCHDEAHLTPRDTATQRVLRHGLEVDPVPAVVSRREDFFGNPVTYFAVQASHPRLVIIARTEVGRDAAGRPGSAPIAWEAAAAHVRDALASPAFEARQFVLDSPMARATPELTAHAAVSFPAGRALADGVADLTARIHREFAYEPGATTIATPLADVLAARRGVCQDFAHLAIAGLRGLGLAARYVSGYIHTEPPAGTPRRPDTDASHAWFAVFDPGAGWLDFDPTNPDAAPDRYVTTAWGRDYGDVTPLKGILFGGGAEHTATVAVDVERLPAVDPATA